MRISNDEWLAGADIGQLGAFEFIAGSLEQRERAAEVATIAA